MVVDLQAEAAVASSVRSFWRRWPFRLLALGFLCVLALFLWSRVALDTQAPVREQVREQVPVSVVPAALPLVAPQALTPTVVTPTVVAPPIVHPPEPVAAPLMTFDSVAALRRLDVVTPALFRARAQASVSADAAGQWFAALSGALVYVPADPLPSDDSLGAQVARLRTALIRRDGAGYAQIWSRFNPAEQTLLLNSGLPQVLP